MLEVSDNTEIVVKHGNAPLMASMQQSMMSAPASAHLQTAVPHLTWTLPNPLCSYLVLKMR